MPVIGNESQVGVAIGHAPAGHVPRRLQGRLGQQRATEQDLRRAQQALSDALQWLSREYSQGRVMGTWQPSGSLLYMCKQLDMK